MSTAVQRLGRPITFRPRPWFAPSATSLMSAYCIINEVVLAQTAQPLSKQATVNELESRGELLLTSLSRLNQEIP